jgi:hypothetical protein
MPARCAIACGVGSTAWQWLAEGQLDKRRTQPPGPQPAGPGAPAGAAFALCSPQRRISPRHEPPPTAGAVGGPSPARMLPLPLGGAERLAGGDGQAGPWDRNHPRVCRHRERAASPHYQQSCPPCPTKISPWEMPGWRCSSKCCRATSSALPASSWPGPTARSSAKNPRAANSLLMGPRARSRAIAAGAAPSPHYQQSCPPCPTDPPGGQP